MFPTKRSLGDGMSRVAYTTPKESYSKKMQRLYRKAKQLQTHQKKKNQKSNKAQAFKTCDDYDRIYWIPQQTLTFPPWVSVSSPLSSQ